MGAVHDVNVWNGPGVRATPTVFDDSGWYAAEGSSWIDADLADLNIDVLQAILSETPPFTVEALALANVATVALVTVDELLYGTPAVYEFIQADDVSITSDADISLQVNPALLMDTRTVPSNTAVFQVPDWIAVDGRPLAMSGLVLNVAVEMGVGAPVELEPFPRPVDVEVNATARWLPTLATFASPGTEWYPYSEYTTSTTDGYTVAQLAALNVDHVATLLVDDLLSGSIIVDPVTDTVLHATTGSAPFYRPTYSFKRGDSLARYPSIAFKHGDYMWTDDINWAATDATFIAVVALRQPVGPWYSVMETSQADAGTLVEGMGVRFTGSGDVVLWHGQQLASTREVWAYPVGGSNIMRSARPMVVGLNLDIVENSATLMVLNGAKTIQTVTLPERLDPTTRMYVGRSPIGELAQANMDVLEFAYFDTPFDSGELDHLLGVYDRIYGVSTP